MTGSSKLVRLFCTLALALGAAGAASAQGERLAPSNHSRPATTLPALGNPNSSAHYRTRLSTIDARIQKLQREQQFGWPNAIAADRIRHQQLQAQIEQLKRLHDAQLAANREMLRRRIANEPQHRDALRNQWRTTLDEHPPYYRLPAPTSIKAPVLRPSAAPRQGVLGVRVPASRP